VAHGRLLFDYYNEQHTRSDGSALSVLYPDLKDESSDPRALSYYPPLSDTMLGSLAGRYRRVWLVLYPDDAVPQSEVSRRIRADLSSHYNTVAEKHIGQVILLLYSAEQAKFQ
jgi:hypothetical protein